MFGVGHVSAILADAGQSRILLASDSATAAKPVSNKTNTTRKDQTSKNSLRVGKRELTKFTTPPFYAASPRSETCRLLFPIGVSC